MNFIVFLCVTHELFSPGVVPLLALNPGDAAGEGIMEGRMERVRERKERKGREREKGNGNCGGLRHWI